MRQIFATLIVATVLTGALPADAKKKSDAQFVVVNEDFGVPVFPYDITDRPYEVIGEIKAEVRKGTIFSKEASQQKIYNELWERAEKLNADAVINANYGDARVTLMSWGSVKATGTAIRFKPVSAVAGAAPAEAAPAAAAPE